MIRKLKSPVCGHVRVTFELPSCIWADRIFITGSFNEWSLTDTPMRQGRDGVWRATIDLPTGAQYEFRYLIDGKWQTDYHADGSRTSEYGVENSVVDTGLPTIDTIQELVASGSMVREAAPLASLPAVSIQPPARPKRPGVQAAA